MFMTEEDQGILGKTIDWLRGTGLDIEIGVRSFSGFVPGIWIDEGVLVVAKDLCGYNPHPGDLCHEAGHLAVLPSRFRKLVTGDVDHLLTEYDKEISELLLAGLSQWPEDPVARAMMQASDAEVIAWSFAAALEMGIDPTLPFVNGFSNDDEASEVYESVSMGMHLGVHGLRAAGFLDKVTDFPIMKKWIQI